jgi:hypothetical protein
MKALTATILALLMALSAPALAKPASCEQIAELAKSIMTARQKGVSMVEMMGVGEDGSLTEVIVVDAYEEGRYRVEANQQRRIADFRDEWFMVCYKSRKGN